MHATLIHRTDHPYRRWLTWTCAMLLAALGISAAFQYGRYVAFRSQLDAVFSPRPSGTATEASWSFAFQRSRCMITVEVDPAEVRAGERLDASAVFAAPEVLSRRYIADFVRAQANSPFVSRLAEEFRAIRDQRGLDSDEYLELIVAAIQVIPYGDLDDDTLLGVEVVAGGRGICTDKSLLLGSLLVHEGYDTVVWLFPTQHHVALGVRSEHAQFRGTGYAFIETTAPGFVGQPAASCRAPGPVARAPMQVAVGGSLSYGAGDQVEVILAELARLRAMAVQRAGYAAYARTPNHPHRARYAERAMESWIADTTASYIMRNTHNRADVYAIITSLNAVAEDSRSGG